MWLTGVDERRAWERSPEQWTEGRRASQGSAGHWLVLSETGTPGRKRGTGLMSHDLCFQRVTCAGNRETRWGLLQYPSEKDGGLDQGGSGRTSKKGSDSGYILNIESTGFLCCLFIKRVQGVWPEQLEEWGCH